MEEDTVGVAEETVSEEHCCSGCNCGCEEACEEPIVEAASEDLPDDVSRAYLGPWREKKFEMDVAVICAFFDVAGFCREIIAKTGVASPTIFRSLNVCDQFLIGNVGAVDEEEAKKSLENGEAFSVKLVPEFLAHFKAWVEECQESFNKMVEAQRKQVVTATSIPEPPAAESSRIVMP